MTARELGVTYHRVRHGSATVRHWGAPCGSVVRWAGLGWTAYGPTGEIVADGLPTRADGGDALARAFTGRPANA